MADDQPFELPSLPARIEPGEFELVFNHDALTGDPVPVFIQFNWDGDTTATFRYDGWISPDEPTSSPRSTVLRSPVGPHGLITRMY